MDVIAYILWGVITLGPLIAYGIYTALRGEPRRADKPTTGTPSPSSGAATS
jgi:hypothetical protein